MPDPSPPPPVEVRGLTVRYRGRTALHDVSLTLRDGVTGLLGPNGAGKTTLMRTVVTSLAPSAGQVAVAGTVPDSPAARREIRRHLGYLPQHPGFYPHFTAADFVEHVAVLKLVGGRSERRAETDRVLEAVGLADRRRTRIKALSGGMRQRVALACALVGAPKVLVLDEPTVGLDPEQRMRFRELVAEVGRGCAVLLSTHQTEDVAALCSQVAVLDEGRIRFTGTPAELSARADGRVWTASERSSQASAAWLTGQGTYRNIGTPPPGAALAEPTLEDGYLLLLESAIRPEVSAP